MRPPQPPHRYTKPIASTILLADDDRGCLAGRPIDPAALLRTVLQGTEQWALAHGLAPRRQARSA